MRRTPSSVLGATVLAALACAERGPDFEPPDEPPDVLLLVVDTLRADHLDLYGYSRVTAPELGRFARSSLVFAHAVAPASWTLPSVASILTGTYPSTHGLQARVDWRRRRTALRPGLVTLAEAFRSAGYRTVATVTNPWVTLPHHRLARGFDVFRELEKGDADAVHGLARTQLGAAGERPTFLYLHYMDVHGPYAVPDPGDPLLGALPEGYRRKMTKAQRADLPGYIEIEGAQRDLAPYAEAYDRGIRRWDASFGRFIQWLEESDRLERTVVSVVSDHGEELLEHGGWNHGLTLYEEQLAVPWVLRAPGLRPGVERKRVVSLIDVAPTLLAAASLPIPETMAGTSAFAEPDGRAPRSIYSETEILSGGQAAPARAQIALRRGQRKWIAARRGGVCFDLEHDRAEQEPSRDADCGAEHFDGIRSWQRETRLRAASLGRPKSFEIRAAEREKLRALGYME